MQEMTTVFFDGKPYEVPSDLTIMTAMEYAGFRLVRGCGCRHGFCGACGTIYRVAGKNAVHFVLACHTQVQENMHIATIPFFPLDKRKYDIEATPDGQTVMRLFPEIFACVGCNSCSKSCPQSINVMQYIAYAKRNDIEKCARESFDCVGCGICSARCPANISHPLVGLLARRLLGKYIRPSAEHNRKAVSDISNGVYDEAMSEIMSMPLEQLREMYNSREIQK